MICCTHCGRSECKMFGSAECEEARKRFFEQQQRRLEKYAKHIAAKRAISPCSPEEK